MVDVSVVIPVYNAERFIAETIDSVLNQSYLDYEIILVDDGSTDRTTAICRRYAREYPDKVRFFRQSNSGPGRARNLGIKMAVGRYIAFLDADDLWMPRKLEKQVRYMERQPPEVGMVYARAVKFDENGVWKVPKRYQKRPVEGWVYWDILRSNPVASPSVLVRKSCFETVGYFDESLDIIEDHDMWLRIAKKFRIAFVGEELCLYREHLGGRSKGEEITLRREIGVIWKHLKMAKDHLESQELIKSILASRLYDLGWYYLREGKMHSARRAFAESMGIEYRWKTALVRLSTYLPHWLLTMCNRMMKYVCRPPKIGKVKSELENFLEEIKKKRVEVENNGKYEEKTEGVF
jgi:glycosyltransferase involved in cell wall biosynthesis